MVSTVTSHAETAAPRLVIPFELVSNIVGYLWNDLETLNACTLVNKSWLGASQPYVLRSVTLHSNHRLSQLRTLIGRTEKLTKVAYWIRELRIDLRKYGQRRSPSKLLRFPEKLFEKLPRLHSIVLFGWYDTHITTNDFFRQLSTFSTVHSLNIVECGLSFPTMQTMVCAFPNLQSFSMRRQGMYQKPPDVTRLCLFKPHLKSLRIEHNHACGDVAEQFLGWITDTGTLHRLRSLSIQKEGPLSFSELRGMKDVLPALGPALQDLDLGFGCIAASDLSMCTRLRRLTFREYVKPSLIDIILRLPKPGTLRKLTFYIPPFHHGASLQKEDYTVLDEILNSAAFGGIKEVRFVYNQVGTGQLDIGGVETEIKYILRGLATKGTIRVVAGVERY